MAAQQITEEWFAVVLGLLFKSPVEAQMLEQGGRGVCVQTGGRRFLNEKRQVAWLGGGQRKKSSRNRQEKQNSVAAPPY